MDANSIDTVCDIRLVNCKNIDDLKIDKRHYIRIDNKLLNSKLHINHVGSHLTKGITHLLTKNRKEPWGVYTTEVFYTCMIKYDTIYKLLSEYNTVIYLDVDTIIRAKLCEHLHEVRDADIALYFDEDQEDFPHAGLIVANRSSRTKECMRYMKTHFDRCITSGDIKIGEGDGDLLYSKCVDFDMNIKRLSNRWKDEGPVFSESSIMWSGRSNNKKDSEQYIKEYNRYKDEHR